MNLATFLTPLIVLSLSESDIYVYFIRLIPVSWISCITVIESKILKGNVKNKGIFWPERLVTFKYNTINEAIWEKISLWKWTPHFHMTLTWKTASTFMIFFFWWGVSLFLSLLFTHRPNTHTHTHTHNYPVYPVHWTQRPPASRPVKTSLEYISCPILFQASHSQSHLFNAYALSWGHDVGMWQGAKGALDSGIISTCGCCNSC